ncbi:acyltransferase [Sphingomonas sp. KR1UV-12]|uniref:Acyltransferase n=1 Tax=Sphingomonas aurea TaxID=3063994 RepID=A0ABT9EMU3_9SPHN|nr:acyltransferase [Sphingomonas sp. KR1UV-12]MDP1028277.1 acyltransferase [Sphingomonas sp. KR1UV-12]
MTGTLTNRDVATYLGSDKATGNPEAAKLDAYPLLDWLRYVLASIVLLDHSGVWMPHPLDAGLAVSVFLALSGWLIGGILLKSDRSDLPRFFFNRSTRIWAPYFTAILLLYGVAAVARGIDGNWFKYLFYDVTFTHYTFTVFPRALQEMPLQGTGNHFWSISVEEQFYLAAPLLMIFTRWGKSIGAWIAVALVLTIMQSMFTPIAFGVAAAVLNRGGALIGSARARWISALAALLFMACSWQWNVQPFRALFSIAAVLTLTTPGRRNRVSIFFGGISYPLYLHQWVGGFAVNAVLKRYLIVPRLGSLLMTYTGSVAVAIVLWWLIDRNVMLHRNSWYTPARGRACTILAYLLVAIGLAGGTILHFLGY